MAGNADFSEAVAGYFKTIHETIIWPALASKDGKKPGPRPDSLVWFDEALMRLYAKVLAIYQPLPSASPCGPDDCGADAECVGGVCVPKGNKWSGPAMTSFYLGKPCQVHTDCEQDERCSPEGFCVPKPIGGFDATSIMHPPNYGVALAETLEHYYGRLHAIVLRGHAVDPRNLPQVRQALMELYLDCARASGRKLSTCESNGDCPDGSACIKGFIVPVPFRLAFSPTPFRAPWK